MAMMLPQVNLTIETAEAQAGIIFSCR